MREGGTILDKIVALNKLWEQLILLSTFENTVFGRRRFYVCSAEVGALSCEDADLSSKSKKLQSRVWFWHCGCVASVFSVR